MNPFKTQHIRITVFIPRLNSLGMKMKFSVILSLFFVITLTFGCPTHLEDTIDITTGDHNGYNIVYKNITFTPDDYFQYKSNTYGCICNIKVCLPKCCSEGKRLRNGRCVKSDRELIMTVYDGIDQSNFNIDNFYLLKTKMCKRNMKKLTANDTYYIQENGHVHSSIGNFTNKTMYCIDGTENSEVIVLVCVKESEDDMDEMMLANYIGMTFFFC